MLTSSQVSQRKSSDNNKYFIQIVCYYGAFLKATNRRIAQDYTRLHKTSAYNLFKHLLKLQTTDLLTLINVNLKQTMHYARPLHTKKQSQKPCKWREKCLYYLKLTLKNESFILSNQPQTAPNSSSYHRSIVREFLLHTLIWHGEAMGFSGITF